jgi:hypothetical protein
VLDLPLVEAFLAQIKLAEAKDAVLPGFAAVALALRFVAIAFHAGSRCKSPRVTIDSSLWRKAWASFAKYAGAV